MLLSVNTALPQTISPVLYTLTEKDGLTDNTVNCFYQDSRGVMWMATNYGLNCYDGSVVTTFHATGEATGLTDETINAIQEDNQQTLWLATGNGLCSLELKSGKVYSYRYNTKDPSLNRYYSLALSENSIFLATEEGLAEFILPQHRFVFHKNPKNIKGCNRITKVLIDSKKRIWLCTYYGLWLYNPQSEQFISYDNPENDPFFDELITDAYEDHKGNIWFGCWSKGLKKLVPSTKLIYNYLTYKGNCTNLLTIAEQKNKASQYELLVSTTLSRLDTSAHTFYPLFPATPENKFLIYASKIYCDRNNLLWIATNEGVRIYNPARQYFSTQVLSPSTPLTSQGISLLPLARQFLLGGEGATAFMIFSDSGNLLKNHSDEIRQKAAVMNIQKDSSHNYWLCTSQGLMILDSSFHLKNHLVHRDNDSQSLPRNFLNTLLFRRNGEIWIFPWRRGIWQIEKSLKKTTRVWIKEDIPLLPASNISKAVEDKNGNIWLTDYTGGLFKYSPKSHQTENVISQVRLSNMYILQNTLWTVSAQQIFAIDINSGNKQTFALPNGKNKYEYDFIPDDYNQLWIATKSGLLVFNTTNHLFRSFTEDDGLYTNLMDITFAKLSNGSMLMAGNTYITTFYPAGITKPNYTVPLLFTGILAGEHEKPVLDSKVHIRWNEKNIILNWASPNFSTPHGNLYYYKLDKIDKSWRLAGNKGQAVYNSLEPGQYTFYYKAASSEGVFSSEKILILVIHPPFWQTWWFRLLAFMSVSLIFYFITRYISQRNLKEQILILEKQQAIEKERNRISRDMHDDLGSGLTRIAILSEVIKKDKNNDIAHLDKISETARNLVDSLDEMVWALNPKNDSLDKLIAYIAGFAHQFLEDTGIDFEFVMPDEIETIYLGEEKRRNIFMSVKEFLNNSVKHSGCKRISIHFISHIQEFELQLKDDGRGFDLLKLNTQGNGIQNMKQRIEDIGGKAEIHSSDTGTTLTIKCGI
jgi:ligand-binding sensor domain-containing protein